MFGSKKSTAPTSGNGKAQPMGTDTIVGAGTLIKGELDTPHAVFIEGEFKGKIRSGNTVVLNDSSSVHADVEAQNLVVHGEVVGNVLVHERLDIGASGKIKGDVKAGSARVAEGGVLDGTCVIVPEGERPAQKFTLADTKKKEEPKKVEEKVAQAD